MALFVVFVDTDRFEVEKEEAESSLKDSNESLITQIFVQKYKTTENEKVDSGNLREGRRRPVSLNEYFAYKEQKRLDGIQEKRNKLKNSKNKKHATSTITNSFGTSSIKRQSNRRKYTHKHKHCYYE